MNISPEEHCDYKEDPAAMNDLIDGHRYESEIETLRKTLLDQMRVSGAESLETVNQLN